MDEVKEMVSRQTAPVPTPMMSNHVTNSIIPSHDLLNIAHKLQVTRLDLIYMDSEYRRNGYV